MAELMNCTIAMRRHDYPMVTIPTPDNPDNTRVLSNAIIMEATLEGPGGRIVRANGKIEKDYCDREGDIGYPLREHFLTAEGVRQVAFDQSIQDYVFTDTKEVVPPGTKFRAMLVSFYGYDAGSFHVLQ